MTKTTIETSPDEISMKNPLKKRSRHVMVKAASKKRKKDSVTKPNPRKKAKYNDAGEECSAITDAISLYLADGDNNKYAIACTDKMANVSGFKGLFSLLLSTYKETNRKNLYYLLDMISLDSDKPKQAKKEAMERFVKISVHEGTTQLWTLLLEVPDKEGYATKLDYLLSLLTLDTAPANPEPAAPETVLRNRAQAKKEAMERFVKISANNGAKQLWALLLEDSPKPKEAGDTQLDYLLSLLTLESDDSGQTKKEAMERFVNISAHGGATQLWTLLLEVPDKEGYATKLDYLLSLLTLDTAPANPEPAAPETVLRNRAQAKKEAMERFVKISANNGAKQLWALLLEDSPKPKEAGDTQLDYLLSLLTLESDDSVQAKKEAMERFVKISANKGAKQIWALLLEDSPKPKEAGDTQLDYLLSLLTLESDDSVQAKKEAMERFVKISDNIGATQLWTLLLKAPPKPKEPGDTLTNPLISNEAYQGPINDHFRSENESVISSNDDKLHESEPNLVKDAHYLDLAQNEGIHEGDTQLDYLLSLLTLESDDSVQAKKEAMERFVKISDNIGATQLWALLLEDSPKPKEAGDTQLDYLLSLLTLESDDSVQAKKEAMERLVNISANAGVTPLLALLLKESTWAKNQSNIEYFFNRLQSAKVDNNTRIDFINLLAHGSKSKNIITFLLLPSKNNSKLSIFDEILSLKIQDYRTYLGSDSRYNKKKLSKISSWCETLASAPQSIAMSGNHSDTSLDASIASEPSIIPHINLCNMPASASPPRTSAMSDENGEALERGGDLFSQMLDELFSEDLFPNDSPPSGLSISQRINLSNAQASASPPRTSAMSDENDMQDALIGPPRSPSSPKARSSLQLHGFFNSSAPPTDQTFTSNGVLFQSFLPDINFSSQISINPLALLNASKMGDENTEDSPSKTEEENNANCASNEFLSC